VTKLYQVSNGAELTANGLSEFVTQAATPMFSVGGSKVAFNFFTGPGDGTILEGGKSLVMMDVERNNSTTYTFSNPVELFKTTEADYMPGWPAFLPDDKGLVFELELQPSEEGGALITRKGARGELWWTDLSGESWPLDRLNGKGYLPTGGEDHDDDTVLQYEPTVAPIVAGGYAWVVFTSRRLYGNVATREAFESDPREFDLAPGNDDGGPTTKKLWVAAIDMPPRPGEDPSHPAFYLPAQELFAGNSRGFWVPQACLEDGNSCQSGDECCGGYCRSNEDGEPVCMAELPPSTCAEEYEACEASADCCDDPAAPLSCIGGRCAQTIVY
jgi:hypothetical protein